MPGERSRPGNPASVIAHRIEHESATFGRRLRFCVAAVITSNVWIVCATNYMQPSAARLERLEAQGIDLTAHRYLRLPQPA